LDKTRNQNSTNLHTIWRLDISYPTNCTKSADEPGLAVHHHRNAQMVTGAFLESQPKGAPLPWKQIRSAKFKKQAFPRTAVATLEMFDGLEATAEVSEIDWGLDGGFTGIDPLNGRTVRKVQHVVSHSTCWLKMEDSACAIRDGKWVRVQSVELAAPPAAHVSLSSPPMSDEDATTAAVAAFNRASRELDTAVGLLLRNSDVFLQTQGGVIPSHVLAGAVDRCPGERDAFYAAARALDGADLQERAI
jgi:hypothetical protein